MKGGGSDPLGNYVYRTRTNIICFLLRRDRKLSLSHSIQLFCNRMVLVNTFRTPGLPEGVLRITHVRVVSPLVRPSLFKYLLDSSKDFKIFCMKLCTIRVQKWPSPVFERSLGGSEMGKHLKWMHLSESKNAILGHEKNWYGAWTCTSSVRAYHYNLKSQPPFYPSRALK